MGRPSLPKALERKLLYESRYVCAVCQQEGCHIHHIDQDNSNNVEANLIVLCVTHHNEAHTKRDLSKNLDAAALRDAKKKWADTVQREREAAATVSGQLEAFPYNGLLGGVVWGYINHRRASQLVQIDKLDGKTKDLLKYCHAKGIVDPDGIIIQPPSRQPGHSPLSNTVYDWFNYGDDQRLHKLYTTFVDQIGSRSAVTHLEQPSWSVLFVRDLVEPGALVFVERAFYFKTISETAENEHRRCHTSNNKLSLEFFVDTIDMFGASSITVSFSGHKSCRGSRLGEVP